MITNGFTAHALRWRYIPGPAVRDSHFIPSKKPQIMQRILSNRMRLDPPKTCIFGNALAQLAADVVMLPQWKEGHKGEGYESMLPPAEACLNNRQLLQIASMIPIWEV